MLGGQEALLYEEIRGLPDLRLGRWTYDGDVDVAWERAAQRLEYVGQSARSDRRAPCPAWRRTCVQKQEMLWL